jgi:hypothetical protein
MLPGNYAAVAYAWNSYLTFYLFVRAVLAISRSGEKRVECGVHTMTQRLSL